MRRSRQRREVAGAVHGAPFGELQRGVDPDRAALQPRGARGHAKRPGRRYGVLLHLQGADYYRLAIVIPVRRIFLVRICML